MLAQSGFAEQVGKRVVLTGGASQLTGLAETARRMLGRNVRARPAARHRRPAGGGEEPGLRGGGRPHHLPAGGADRAVPAPRRGRRAPMTGTDGYLARVGRWIKDSF